MASDAAAAGCSARGFWKIGAALGAVKPPVWPRCPVRWHPRPIGGIFPCSHPHIHDAEALPVTLDALRTALADRYTLERELGAGGMATVFLAHDRKHDRRVAIKVLRPELAAVLGAERFVQEIRTTAALSHPHILPLFDSGEAGGQLYYVMPYVDGETLRNRLDRETQLPVPEALRITRDVADALDYAHRHGVVHRDIKPENILLHDGRPMVADFGIALAVSAAAGGRMTETGLSLGTPHYMSPEQATADKEITHRSDIYSLGSVLYEMLTGEPPHLGTSAQQIIMKIVTEDAPPVTKLRKSVPPNVAAAVATAIQKLPADGTNPLYYPSPWEPEFFGDVAVVNGATWPVAEVASGWYRLRLLNGSSSRIYHLALDPGRPFLQIGTDTGLVGRARKLTRLILAPGERADVLVDFGRYPAGSTVRLLNLPLPEYVVSPADVEIGELMQFSVTSARGLRGAFPAWTYPGYAELRQPDVTNRRTVLLTEIMDPETEEPVMALLNARPWMTDDIERPVVNTLEQWDIVNLTADTHPIHLHLVQFQALDRQPINAGSYLQDVFGTDELHPSHIGSGARPFPSVDGYLAGARLATDAWERGWKDTVQAHPGMVTRILVPFGPAAAPGVPFGTRLPTPFTGRYVWHCHILDHEDNEMMLPYEVMP